MAYSRKNFLKLTGLSAFAILGGAAKPLRISKNSTKSLIKPNRISRTSTLGLIAPASPVYKNSDFDEMLITLKNQGYTLKLGKHVRDRRGFLAGTDKDRAADLMSMFKDPNVDAILCVRGGWGCNRILDYIDFDVIKNNPKPLIGFSDITTLHMSIAAKTGLVSFHGPVGTSDWNEFTQTSFDNVLIKGAPEEYLIPEDDLYKAYTIRSGKATGPIYGGNLTVLTAMIGSNYLPDFKDSILFLEDVGESVYRIDRMLTQLKLAGILDNISGFIFGQCTDCKAGENSLTLNQVLDDHIKPLGIPAYYGAMISHEAKNVTIPVGMNAEMNADSMSFSINQPSVI